MSLDAVTDTANTPASANLCFRVPCLLLKYMVGYLWTQMKIKKILWKRDKEIRFWSYSMKLLQKYNNLLILKWFRDLIHNDSHLLPDRYRDTMSLDVPSDPHVSALNDADPNVSSLTGWDVVGWVRIGENKTWHRGQHLEGEQGTHFTHTVVETAGDGVSTYLKREWEVRWS